MHSQQNVKKLHVCQKYKGNALLYLHDKTGTRTQRNIRFCVHCSFCYCVYYFYTREFCVKSILFGTKKKTITRISKSLFSSAKDDGFYAFKHDNNCHKEIPALSCLVHNNLFCLSQYLTI